MQVPKKYFHDRLVLLLLTVNGFIAALTSVLILLRLDGSRSDSYIIEYRENLGLNAFSSGDSTTFWVFVAFVIAITAINTLLSIRIYEHHRKYSITILALGLLLLFLALIVSNALLVLR